MSSFNQGPKIFKVNYGPIWLFRHYFKIYFWSKPMCSIFQVQAQISMSLLSFQRATEYWLLGCVTSTLKFLFCYCFLVTSTVGGPQFPLFGISQPIAAASGKKAVASFRLHSWPTSFVRLDQLIDRLCYFVESLASLFIH